MNNVQKLNLTASARLIMQLGEQLIEDELVALLELIKNGYDADAKVVNITIETTKETEFGLGQITISDDGNGMLPSIIKNAFLKLSTNFKEEEKSSIYFNRRVLGKKGIGRLSFQRLGRFIDIKTAPRIDRYVGFSDSALITIEDEDFIREYNAANIKIDWSDFPVDMNFQDITADVEYLRDEPVKYGTEIKIYGIRNINFWDMDKKKEAKLKGELLNMINPFENSLSDNLVENKFKINLKIDQNNYPIEKIDEALLEKLYDTKIVFSFSKWKYDITLFRKRKYILNRQNSKISEMQKSSFRLMSQEPIKDVVEEFHYDFKDVDYMKLNYPNIEINFEKVLNKTNKEESFEFAYPGDFNGVLYARDLSNRETFNDILGTKLFQDRKINTFKMVNEIWKSIQGLFVYRNGFRILPYGKKDWIGFTPKSQTDASNIFKEHTVVGYIEVDGFTSEKLEEQTNRQGFVLDEYGKNFLFLLQNTLLNTIFNSDVEFRSGYIKVDAIDNYIRTKNKILVFEKVVPDEVLKRDRLEVLQSKLSDITQIVQSPKPNLDEAINIVQNLNVSLDDFVDLDKKVEQAAQQTIYLKDQEIRSIKDVIPILGLGIVAEALTHEMNRIEKNINHYAKTTIDGIRVKETIEKLIGYQRNIITETNFLSSQINHMEAMYKKNEKYTEEIDMRRFLYNLYCEEKSPMSRKAVKDKIHVKIIGGDFSLVTNKGYLTTIFDNIFLNSLYWVAEYGRERYICFNIIPQGIIECHDSGPGIHPSIEDELFEPFKYKKKDGRGLGLYIVNELINEMNSKVYLSSERRDGRKYKFILDFSNLVEEL